MRHRKCMDTFGVIGDRLYEVLEVYMEFSLYGVWESYGDPMPMGP